MTNTDTNDLLHMADGQFVEKSKILIVCAYMNHFKSDIEFCKRKGIACDWENDTVEMCSLKYHSEWDWLIPVASKCVKNLSEIKGRPIGDESGQQIWSIAAREIRRIEESMVTWDIRQLWQAVIQAIEVINQYKNTI